jgi:hypothetical protein
MSKVARIPSPAQNPAQTGWLDDAILVRGTRIPIRIGEMKQADLRYFVENPRVYSLVRSDEGSEPTQEEIERALQAMEHVRDLVHDIRANGGLIDPLYVRAGTLDVIEGNSRLAAYRYLAANNPISWGRVKCALLPADIDDSLVSALLGQWHLKGKKEWPPFEQAGYLYRRHTVHGVPLEDLAAEVGLSRTKVARLLETYGFMAAHGDTEREHWSYYDEYTKSRKIGRAREIYPQLDRLVVAKIASGEIARAADLRDKLPVICESKAKALKRFVSGGDTFEEAYERAVESGGDHTPYQKLSKFRKWIAQQEVQDALASSDGALGAQITFELKQLLRLVGGLQKKRERQ